MSTELEEVITCSSLECSSLACIIPSCVPIRAEMLLHLIDTFVIRLKPGPVVPPYGWLEIAAGHPSAFLRLDTLADLAATSRFFLYRLLVDSRGSRIRESNRATIVNLGISSYLLVGMIKIKIYLSQRRRTKICWIFFDSD